MFRPDRFFPVWIYLPWNNLGCLGFKIGFGMYGLTYGDLTLWPSFGHIYLRLFNRRYTSNIRRPWHWSRSCFDGQSRRPKRVVPHT